MMPKLPARIEENLDRFHDCGLLLLRLGSGLLMAFAHGYPKLIGFAEKSASFADPLHIGSTASLALAVFAEFFCALAVAAGLWTRLATLPVIITMGVVIFLVHGDDPFKVQEKGWLFLLLYAVILLTGPGKYALDTWIARLRRPG
jgi:putative oxidoreductase